MCLCRPLQLGDAAGLRRVLTRMEAAGVPCEGLTYLALAKGCEDGGLSQLASEFYDQAEKKGVDLANHQFDVRPQSGAGRGVQNWRNLKNRKARQLL